MFALGLLSWLYHRPIEGTLRVPRRRSSPRSPTILRGQHRRLPGRLDLRRDHRGLRRLVRGQAGRACRPAPTATSPATWRCRYGLVAAGQLSGLPLFLGAYPITPASRHPARAEQAQAVRRAPPFQAEDEIAGIGAALGAVVRRRARRHHHLRPRRRAEVRDDRPGGLDGAAAGHRRRPARRALDRPADQDRAGRPAAGHVRPQRRGARSRSSRRASPSDCFDAAIEAARIATEVPHAGVPALRRLPGQRLRAVADPGRRRRCPTCAWTSPPSRNADDGTELLAVPARPGDAGPPVGRSPAPPGSSTASAASRRPTAPATSPTTRPTTTSWCAPGRPRSTASPATSTPLEVDDPSGEARRARARLGLDVRADRRGAAGASAGKGLRRRAGPPAPPQPVPGQHRRGARALRQGGRPGDEPRPARTCCIRGKYLVDAIGYNQVRGLPFKAESSRSVIEDVITS